MKKLNLGSGVVTLKGYMNLDNRKCPGVDVVHDLNKKPYPFKTNTFKEVYASHVLEHLDDLVMVMEQLYRICAHGARLKILVPYFASPNNAIDPTHKRQFNYQTFNFFSSVNRYKSGAKGTGRFRIVKRKIIVFSNAGFMKSKWYSWPFDVVINLFPLVYERLFCYYLPAAEIHYEIEVVKK